ncbi:MAG: NAD(P)-dependent glycerol-3-phosphate dehydrogenase [Candidatus Daviesbacteria bacterium]|nr:NAD(P)-dependent glycerol-3-phosphate dehydrogenase [Candidatus Daviesbacteria bacterium]
MRRLNIAILPAGVWGTALVVPVSDNGHRVTLYFRQNADAKKFNEVKRNLKRLPEIRFNGQVSATSNLKKAISGANILVLACDVYHVRNFFKQIKPFVKENMIILCSAKGIEKKTNLCMSEVLSEVYSNNNANLAVMSGPNFAVEVAKRLPTMTVIASKKKTVGNLLQKAFSTENFKVYTQDDVLGVELGGALKNVIAIGVGIGEGLRMGENCRAALITRGIAEMIKLGTVLGANKLTFAGLSGMGDLILTCTSAQSRNYKAGFKIGRGMNPKDLLTSGETIEGLRTVKVAVGIAKKKNIEIPIMEMVYKIVYQGLKPKIGFRELMKFELSSENGD